MGRHCWRTSTSHWAKLSSLLASYERCFVACARFDAHRTVEQRIGPEHHGLIALNRRLGKLRAQVDRELNRETVEALTRDLRAKQHRDQRSLTP